MSRLVLTGVLVVAVMASATAAAPAEEVTLTVNRTYDPASRTFRVEFSGVISSGAANEYVTVMQQKCGFNFSTAIAGTTTHEGGAWVAFPSSAAFSSGTYRARWKGHLSEPATFRPPISIYLTRRGKGYRIALTANGKLSSRYIALQRLAGGRWTHVRRIQLDVRGQAGYGGVYEATFRVRKRGLTMRMFVPEKTAAPCYLPGASATFRS